MALRYFAAYAWPALRPGVDDAPPRVFCITGSGRVYWRPAEDCIGPHARLPFDAAREWTLPGWQGSLTDGTRGCDGHVWHQLR